MSKTTQSHDDEPRKKRKSVKYVQGALFGLMALSMLSFGVAGFSTSSTRIGKVGGQEIAVNDYVQALNGEVQRLSQMIGQPISLRDAIASGVDKQALSNLVTRAALDDAAGNLGLSVGDAEVAAELVKINAFKSLDGGFDRDAYAQALKSQNRSEADFEAGLRADIARNLLQTAISNGAATPDVLTKTLFSYVGETRDISFAVITPADLPTPVASPTDADLQAEYDANIATYTRPEAKRIAYVALLPQDLAADMPLDEAALKAAYEAGAERYNIPEKRLVERLVYPDAAAAEAARAKLDAGASFEDLVAERKLALEDIDLGEVALADLGVAGAAVFALTEPGVAGPLDSDLGPALFRMNAILPAQTTPFEAARSELAAAQQQAAARKAIADRVDAIDDALAGGATLDDLAASEKLTLASTDYAKGADDNDEITADPGFAKAADALAEGDFPEAILLENGGVAAMTLTEILPPTPRPLADVKDKLAAAWSARAQSEALKAEGEARLAKAVAGAELASLGTVTAAKAVARGAPIEGAVPALGTRAFDLALGEVALVAEGSFAALLRVDAITPADAAAEAEAQRATLKGQLDQSFAGDVFALFGQATQAAAGLTLDQSVIEAVHVQMGN